SVMTEPHIEKTKTTAEEDRKTDGSRIGRLRRLRDRWLLQEDLNFLLTNRIPRAFLTHAMGHLSRIRSPWLTRVLIAVWRLFTDLDLSESRRHQFESLRDCFTRELKPGARPIHPDPSVLVSPCDGIVGAFGKVRGTEAFQAKGFPYSIEDLFGTAEAAHAFQDGLFITLRLTSSMYHRFHSPDTATLEQVTSISGDTWNVNPIALRRIEALFCRNERAVVRLRLGDGAPVALVAVAAILVASVRLHCLDLVLHRSRKGPREFEIRHPVDRGEELGWFEHGSTIILFAPNGFKVHPRLQMGDRIRVGEPLVKKAGFPGSVT
ncbi:MAG: archaetidylserine decarboxylase, partial [Verrucomicrobium sp.]|nr:archaetidylserine decarboxylase [Verrucomicrobium sp.]